MFKKLMMVTLQYIVSRVLILTVLFGLISASLLFVINFQLFLKSPINDQTTDQIVLIESGSSITEITKELKSRAIIHQPIFFEWYARLSSQSRKIKAGQYRLIPGMTPQDVLTLFTSGRSIQYQFTIIEGQNFAQLRKNIEQDPNLKQTLQGLSHAEVMEKLGHPDVFPEGRFLPETYYFPMGYSDLELLKRSFNDMNTFVESVWEARNSDLPFSSPLDLLTMASIVEKETGIASERATIAGVFTRRLELNMRLQTDPTVIYGLGENYTGRITRQNLETDTPYNTYTRHGLPPTPIAMPSKAAIMAAANPEPGDFLYFVAKGDGSGEHIFSKSLQEHNAAVAQYRRQMRQNAQ